MSALRRYSEVVLRSLIALLFIFSGATKSIDCVGTSLYVTSHLDTLYIGVPNGVAEVLALLLGASELSLGILLLFNILPRVTRLVAMLMVALFTLVTLLNVTLFPLEDCGCFGDVVSLSTEATFLKNVVLLPLVVILWLLGRRREGCAMWHLLVAAIVAVGAISLNIYTLRHLPLIDILPYSVGTSLREAVIEEREARELSSHTELIFRGVQDGLEHRFAADDVACWLDEDLEYVGVESVTDSDVEWLYDDFLLIDSEGRDRALDMLMEDCNYLWLCISSSRRLAELGGVEQLVAALQSLYPEYRVAVLSSVAVDVNSGDVALYGVDSSTLRTMMRADVGVMLLRSGVVEAKLNIRDLEL